MAKFKADRKTKNFKMYHICLLKFSVTQCETEPSCIYTVYPEKDSLISKFKISKTKIDRRMQ